MSKGLHEIINYFETNNNSVSKAELIKELKFSQGKIQKLMSGNLVRIEYGRYALSTEFYKKFEIILPEGVLRLDRQTFEFSPETSKFHSESLIRSKIFERANLDNLLIKKINFGDNQYNIEFLPARYSTLNNHVVFDAISKSPEELIKQARVWEGRGRWELGQYFRKIAEAPPQDYHLSVAEVMSFVRKKHGDIGRLEKLSENHHGIVPTFPSPETKTLSEVSGVRFDSKTDTYIFNEDFHKGSEREYKSLFSEVSAKLGLHAKRFVSMTFKKVLPAVGLVLSGSRIASADNKIEATFEEGTIITGGIQGGLIAALLATPTGPIGMAAAGLAGSITGSELTAGYHSIRRKFKQTRTSDSKTEKNEVKLNLPSQLITQHDDEDQERLKIYEDSYHQLRKTDEKGMIPYHSSAFSSGIIEQVPQSSRTKTKKSSKKISTRKLISSTEEIKLTSLDKTTAEFLVAYGASPKQVAQLYQDPANWALAKEAFAQFQEQERKLERQQDQVNCISFFTGVHSIFSALAQSRSPELAHIGSLGAPIMMGLVHVETLWGVFSGSAGSLATVGVFGSFGAIGGLVAAGIGLLNVFLGSDNENQQRQLMESLSAIHEHISTFRREVHERFDRVETALQGIANMMMGYCNQILKNQKMLFEQNQKHIELSIRGFSVVTSMLNDLRFENRQFYERVFRELSYLTDLAEIEPIQKLQESIERKVHIIKRKAEMKNGESSHRTESMISKLSDLEFDLKCCTSNKYNGKNRFALLANNSLQSLRFLVTRSLNRDDALGFLAEEFERLTSTSLAEAKIDKTLLPVTALWSNAILQYITLSRLPVFADFDSSATLAEIQKQSEAVIQFSHHIRESKVITILLKKHHQHLYQFQLTLYHYFSEQQKKLIFHKEEEKVAEKRLRVGDYFSDGADQKALNEIDYNYVLLTRFSELAGLTPELQQQIARLDKSAVLLEQPFNFNETPKSVYACNLIDASFTVIGDHIYKYPFLYEHFEDIGAVLYGNPGEEKMVFISSQIDSENRPGAAEACSLNLSSYDLTACRYAQLATIHPHIGKSPFPLIKYKGNFNDSANHVWASSHIVTLSGRPHFVLHTGGSDYVAICDIKEQKREKQWLDCNNDERPAQFTVPLSSRRSEVKPDTTCYTHVIRNRHLIITKVNWLGSSCPKITFHGYDLMNKRRLKSYEAIKQFTCRLQGDNLRGESEEKLTSPNQFYINKIQPVNQLEAMVFGILQSGERLSASFYYNPIESKGPNPVKMISDMKEPSFGTRTFSISVKTIHQTNSQVLHVDDENILLITASVTTPDDKIKLVVISVDYWKNKIEMNSFDLPSLHLNSDWQVMRTAIAKIGDREHLIITLLNPEYQMMIFSYDPNAKELSRLIDGPQLKFIKLHENSLKINFSFELQINGCDTYLLKARDRFPGFYPVRPIEIRVKELQGISTLLIAYPTVENIGPLNYQIKVMHIPLAPVLKIKSSEEIIARLPASNPVTPPSLEIPANHLAAELSRTQLLLSLPPVPAVSLSHTEDEVKILAPTDSLSEINFESAFEICNDAKILLSTTIPDLKLENERLLVINQKIARMDSAIIESAREIKPAKILNFLRTIFNTINMIDGILKQNNQYMSSTGIGKNIDSMLGQLKDEIARLDRAVKPKPPSPLVERGMFSERTGVKIRSRTSSRQIVDNPISKIEKGQSSVSQVTQNLLS